MNKLIHVKGDAVKALKQEKVDFLMHCCNAQGVMGSGIALQVKNTFPDVYTAYSKHCSQQVNALGTVIVKDDVINIIAQQSFGTKLRHLHYGALVKCFMIVIDKINSNELYKYKITDQGYLLPYRIAIPKYMGSDRAGGNWKIVEELLESFPSQIEIYCYELEV
jgi:hypothetical protein